MSDESSELAGEAGSKAAGTEPEAKGASDAESKAPASAPEKPPVTTPAQWAFLAVVSLATAGVDLWSKAWAIKRLSVASPRPVPLCTPPPGLAHYQYQRIPSEEVTVLRNWVELRYAENCGGAWGLLHGASEKLRKPFFLLVTIAAIVFIVKLYKELEPEQKAMRWALPLVLGGALGNLVDRLRLGYVVDFIDMHYKTHHWPTYNIADVAITVGIGLMLLKYVFGEGPKAAPVKAPQKKPSPA